MPGLREAIATLAGFEPAQRAVATTYASALEDFCAQLARVRAGGNAEPAPLAAGLDALGAICRGVASAGASTWQARVGPSPAGGRHVSVLSPLQELRLAVDDTGAAWFAAWLPQGATDLVVFQLRANAAGGYELLLSHGPRDVVAPLPGRTGLEWTQQPSLGQPDRSMLGSLGISASARQVAGDVLAGAAIAGGAALLGGAGAALAAPARAGWHYSVAGRSEGPVPELTLREWLAEGRLPPETPVWQEGLADWTTAQQAGLVATTATHAPEWYYSVGGQQQGPIAESSLREWLAEGRLRPETPVWNAQLADWTSAEAAGLVAAAQPIVAAPRAQAPAPQVDWYYSYDGNTQGPVSETDLRGWLQEGRLGADTPVWCAGLPQWTTAGAAGLVAVVARR